MAFSYRKLTGDVKWPASTPVAEAIGPLAGAFPILSLRTSKADVVVGVDQAKADALDASGEKWRVNGKYAMISFVLRGIQA
ncbi:HRT2_2 [Sanghuangporus vaninii]